ncbi:MAG: leucine-rich repeat protein [Oscillospiraceae bacterium]|nr:leucine-rich repeat protein [Oscillospiraceae bacterium]
MKKVVSLILALCFVFLAFFIFDLHDNKASAFSGNSGDWFYSGDDEEQRITSLYYYGTDAHVQIPTQIDGFPITDLNNLDFDFNNKIETLTIPEGITSIRYLYLFYCENFTTLNLPASITNIEYFNFSECSNFTAVIVDSGNADFSSQDGVLYNKDKTQILLHPCNKAYTSFVIPNSVTSIGDYAFSGCSNLTSITIPTGVTKIGAAAFENCGGLTSVEIPNVTELGSHAFSGCNGLTSFTIPSGITQINSYTFQGCIGLTSINIPPNITSIGGSAFSGCRGLTAVTIPGNVKSIGESAFSFCRELTSITFQNGVESIGGSAFLYCDKLSSVTIPDSVTYIGMDAFNTTPWYDLLPNGLNYLGRVAYKWKGTMPPNTQIVLKSDTVSISARAFLDCANLETIYIPNGVLNIGYGAFNGCSGITALTLPNRLEKIEMYAFSKTNISSIIIPDSVTSVGSYAFQNCTKLTTARLSENITTIPGSMFSGCFELSEVNIPNGVTRIDGYAFRECRKLKSVTIPENVTSIGVTAFNLCTDLESVVITKGLELLLLDAFRDCGSLTSIWLESDTPLQINGDAGTISDIVTFYVPIDLKSDYRTFTALDKYNVAGYCNVEFDTRGGSYIEPTKKSIENNKLVRPADPDSDFYVFDGWYKEADCINEWNFNTSFVNDNMTLYAKWIPKTYSITYNLNGGINASGAPSVYSYGINTVFPVPSRENYVFDGWYTFADFSGVPVNSTGTGINGNLNLYAKWSPKTYKVIYNANGGVGVPLPQTKTHGVILTLSGATPARSGFIFRGWSMSATILMPNYQPGAIYTDDADIELYAVWEKASPCTYYGNDVHICEINLTERRVQLHNSTNKSLNTRGLYLADSSKDDAPKLQMPQIVIKPGGTVNLNSLLFGTELKRTYIEELIVNNNLRVFGANGDEIK